MKVQKTIQKKKKLFLFNEAQLLENLTRKNIHADELVNITHWEFKQSISTIFPTILIS